MYFLWAYKNLSLLFKKCTGRNIWEKKGSWEEEQGWEWVTQEEMITVYYKPAWKYNETHCFMKVAFATKSFKYICLICWHLKSSHNLTSFSCGSAIAFLKGCTPHWKFKLAVTLLCRKQRHWHCMVSVFPTVFILLPTDISSLFQAPLIDCHFLKNKEGNWVWDYIRLGWNNCSQGILLSQ